MRIPGHVTDHDNIVGKDVEFKSGADTITGYLVLPNSEGPHPAIIVIHEAFGLVEHEKDIARRFAKLGFVALAPNLYSRINSPDPHNFAESLGCMFALPDAQAVKDLEAAADYLLGLAATSDRVGCIGFCSGGRHTLLFACQTKKLNAAIDAWGGFVTRASPNDLTTETRPVPVVDLIQGLDCPLFIAVGDKDENPSPAVAQELASKAIAAGKVVDSKVYESAGHAFFADWRPNYVEKAAFEFWDDAVSFLSRHLKA